MTTPNPDILKETPWQLEVLRDRVADGHVAQDCPVASIDWILNEREQLRAKVEKLEMQLHRARLLWCDSKRDPETGSVSVRYLDQFEEALDPTKGEIKK